MLPRVGLEFDPEICTHMQNYNDQLISVRHKKDLDLIMQNSKQPFYAGHDAVMECKK